ncbi:hypothetical protein QFZ79_001286 [Arthrobacter sp. V4I6]|uniref:hypothetical protein n=1 Tax=unclassified Arthrobacter TaxID=235627 RepID=UPI00277F4368|nr:MULTISPECIES: hypothetical protein [unclassified Arthrobacter]MDQ0823540.1 hypothetical protein [Arthrobacter sp. V1I7]MDQ0853175.1 hypothetical protein [Arthrobacter sp. V4I6]
MAESAPPGSGAAPRPSAPADDGVLRIRGGLGGLTFQFEELLAGAGALDGLVRQLASVEAESDAVRRDLFPFQADSYTSGSDAIIAAGEGSRALGRVREELGRLCGDVRASHREYEFTEARNSLLLRIGRLGPGYGPLWGLFGMPALTARDVLEDEASLTSGRLALLLGIPAGLARGTDTTCGPPGVREVVRGLGGATGLAGLLPRPVRITGAETRQEQVDASPAGLLSRAGTVGGTNGEIEVLRLDEGSRPAWVIVIPGTQPDGLPAGTNPFDAGGIAEGLGYGSAETTAAIKQALRAAGAEAGQPLAAVGYSQGGIHAMNLSQDEAFLAEFDLKFVLTAGSPVGGITPEPGISSLHLEHEQDWVPGADGLASPDTKDRVTVTLTNALEVPPLDDFGLGPGHGLGNYAAGAEAVAASQDLSLRTSAAALAAVVGSGGPATVTRFSLRREALPPQPGKRRADAPGPRPDGRPDRSPGGNARGKPDRNAAGTRKAAD